MSRRNVLAGMGVGAAALALVGCGDDDSSSKPATTQKPGTSAAGSATAAPKRGGTLAASYQNRPPNLDVHMQSTVLVNSVVGNAYSRLLAYKTGPGIVNQLQPVGDLALNWETPDPTTYVFHLRPNAKYHNIDPVNGRVVTAADIVYSYTRQRDLKTNATYVSDIDTMTAVDNGTLRLTLKQPYADFLTVLASGYNKIIAREVVDKFGDLKTAPAIGSGPFISDKVTDQSATFKRNPDYFIPGLPYLDGLKRVQIDDLGTAEAAFRTGDIHTVNVSSKELPGFQSENSKYQVFRSPNTIAFGTEVNASLPQFSDVRVRQAIAYAINRKAVIDAIWFKEGALTSSISNIDSTWELSEAELAQVLPYDPAKAQALLKAAGAQTDFKLTVWNDAASSPAGELIAPMLQAAGFKPSIQLVDNATALAAMTLGQGLVVHQGAWANFPSVTLDLRSRFKTGGGWNGSKFSDADLDTMIENQAKESDAAKRKQMVGDIQRKLFSTVLTFIPTTRPVVIALYRPDVRTDPWFPYASYEGVNTTWLDT